MKSAKCLECGFVGWADAEVCKRCGAPVDPGMAAESNYAQQPPASNYEQQPPASNYEQQPPAYNYAQQPPAYNYQVNQRPNESQLKKGLAITAMVVGICNFIFLGIFGVTIIVGIVLSVVALNRIKRSPFVYGGKQYAMAGLIINCVSLIFLVPLILIAAVALPNLVAARRAAYEASALSSLSKIYSAQEAYQNEHVKFGTLADLERENLITPELASGLRNGYRFTVETVADRGDGLPGFVAVAVPNQYPHTGRRSFFLDESGVLRGGDFQGAAPTRYDTPINLDSNSSSERSASRRRRQNSEE